MNIPECECPYCFAPLPAGKRHSCVPLRGRLHPTNAFYFNDNGQARLVRLHKGSTLPKNAPPSLAIDRYPRPWDAFEPLGPVCAAMEAAGLPQEFGREAATVALEYEGVADLMRQWAASNDKAERWTIVPEIEELLADIQKIRAHEWESTVPVTREWVQRLKTLVSGVEVDLNEPLPKDPED